MLLKEIYTNFRINTFMKYNKNIRTFLLFILISFAWSCGDSLWKGQETIKEVETNTLPVQHQLKGIFDLGNGLFCSNDFDGARMNGIVLTDDTLITVLITPENTPINSSPWYSFKIWSETKQNLFLKLTYLEGVRHRYYPKLSYDGINWQSIDSANFINGLIEEKKNSRKLPNSLTTKLTFGPDTLWVSAQELITSKHVDNWMKGLATKPFVSMDEIGKSLEGRPLDMLKIGTSNDQKMIIVLSRQHPPEVSGYLAMQAFVETICDETEIAKKFRDEFNTYVIPIANPDGVDNGHWRHNSGGVDLNRDWGKFNQPETSAIKVFMHDKVETTKGKFYFGVDFHSTWEDIYYTLDPKLKGNMPGLVTDMINSMSLDLPDPEPNIQPRPNDARISSLTYFYYEFGAEPLVFEIGDETPRNYIKRKGEIAALKLMELMTNEGNH